MKDKERLFEVISPQQSWTIYTDGHIEGFPEDALIFNRYPALALKERYRHGLESYIQRQADWSQRTFGAGRRTKGIVEHIRKELKEILATDGNDLEEWIDVIILALDGYWRHGGHSVNLMSLLNVKQAMNFLREWPEPTSEDEPVEHIRE